MIVVTGSLTARPDSFEALREVCLAHSRRSRAEPGCVSHNAYVDCEQPLRLFFYEEWIDRAALEAHFAVPDSNHFMKAVRSLSAASDGPHILMVAD